VPRRLRSQSAFTLKIWIRANLHHTSTGTGNLVDGDEDSRLAGLPLFTPCHTRELETLTKGEKRLCGHVEERAVLRIGIRQFAPKAVSAAHSVDRVEYAANLRDEPIVTCHGTMTMPCCLCLSFALSPPTAREQRCAKNHRRALKVIVRVR
jgi:hypothetical protein